MKTLESKWLGQGNNKVKLDFKNIFARAENQERNISSLLAESKGGPCRTED
jgi:hypothetical protein